MSGSSHGRRAYSRCVVELDANVSIAWEPGPDGAAAGQRYHQEEEQRLLARLDAAAPALEVLLDQLEERVARLHPASAPGFEAKAQHGQWLGGAELTRLWVWAEPALAQDGLVALAAQVGRLLQPGPGEATLL